ncbi:dienelactone hydrolase family protein [Pararobbsia silviterrae]|uniref:Dienelactone hydrolase family protein n=1 Tax=Pararobbsia silviterrae TaxID=1792498 RepID=A0A494XGP5_9BURK|nr:dienelactone hydrolase family protein [Pararobbsia silviterrae]RKP49708.1 dienelactone hydrolase family protein [Pararobbsia silviterrae]
MKKAQGSLVSFRRPDGGEVQGYLAKPEKLAGAPAVVVVQEWWGLNDQIRGVADRLAQSGYLALVPDLFRGKSTVEEAEANHLMSGLDFGDAATQDIRGAVEYLKQQASRVAVMGYCMGGALTLLTLSNVPDVSAGVLWYGFPPLDYINPSAIKGPVLGHWATQDEFFPIDTVGTLETRLRDAGVSVEFHRYLAHHAFANETAVGDGRIAKTQFDPVWAQLAWDRTLTFLGRTLWDQPPGKA